jgi:hypothetical protein
MHSTNRLGHARAPPAASFHCALLAYNACCAAPVLETECQTLQQSHRAQRQPRLQLLSIPSACAAPCGAEASKLDQTYRQL